MKRRLAPQFDLPGQEQVFNLRVESATDGERLARERAQLTSDEDKAQRRQPELTALPLRVAAWRLETVKTLQ